MKPLALLILCLLAGCAGPPPAVPEVDGWARLVAFEDARALVVGPLGALYVLDAAAATVAYVDPKALVRQTIYGGTGLGRDALLGPLAVLPERQRQGLGSALVRAGLDALRDRGTRRVLVLGDPAYYARFGFAPERGTAAPYDLPEAWRDAWQSLALSDESAPKAKRLAVPAPWRDPALWAP